MPAQYGLLVVNDDGFEARRSRIASASPRLANVPKEHSPASARGASRNRRQQPSIVCGSRGVARGRSGRRAHVGRRRPEERGMNALPWRLLHREAFP